MRKFQRLLSVALIAIVSTIYTGTAHAEAGRLFGKNGGADQARLAAAESGERIRGNVANQDEWNKDDRGFTWRYSCGLEPVESVVLILHDTNSSSRSKLIEDIPTPGNIVDRLLDECSLVTHIKNNDPAGIWDYTGQRSSNRETARLIHLVKLANNLQKPVLLLGEGTGGIMAYKIASETTKLGKGHLVSRLIVVDGSSPYPLSVRGVDLSLRGPIPANFNGLDPVSSFETEKEKQFETHFGATHYTIEGDKDHLILGLANDEVTWDIPTLIAYSNNDKHILKFMKDEFAQKLYDKSNTTQVVAVDGAIEDENSWPELSDWLFDSDSSRDKQSNQRLGTGNPRGVAPSSSWEEPTDAGRFVRNEDRTENNIKARQEVARLAGQERQAGQDEARKINAKIDAEKAKAARIEAARIEAARIKARQEAARLARQERQARQDEARKINAEKAKAARIEAARIEAARIEAARIKAAAEAKAKKNRWRTPNIKWYPV